jgi:hypothetical protein
MLSVIMLSVIKLNAIMLSAVAYFLLRKREKVIRTYLSIERHKLTIFFHSRGHHQIRRKVYKHLIHSFTHTHYQGIRTEEGGLGTVDLLIKVACFKKG